MTIRNWIFFFDSIVERDRKENQKPIEWTRVDQHWSAKLFDCCLFDLFAYSILARKSAKFRNRISAKVTDIRCDGSIKKLRKKNKITEELLDLCVCVCV